MKPRFSRRFLNSTPLRSFNVALTFPAKPLLLAVACSLGAVSLTPLASAQSSYTYDADTITAGAQDGAGAGWNTSTLTWLLNGGGSDVVWNNSPLDTAVFGSGSTGGTVAVASGINVGTISFGTTVTTAYTLSGGPITLGGAAAITNTNTLGSTISAKISGSSGLNFSGVANTTVGVTLSGANDYTGITTVSTGGRLTSNATGFGSSAGATASTLGTNYTLVNTGAGVGLTGSSSEAFIINGIGQTAGTTNPQGAIRFAAGMTLSSLVQLGSSSQITSNGSGAVTMSGNLDLAGFTLSVGNGTQSFNSGVPLNVSGVLQGGSTSILDIGAAGGANLVNLTGSSNTFSGTVRVNFGTGASYVGLGNDNALGTGTLVFSNGGVQSTTAAARTITNTIGTFTGNANFGPTSGTNVGTLNFTSTSNTSLGTAVRTLTTNVDTTIAAALTNTGGITKLGAATLTLNGANTFSGATLISAGTLTLGNALALQNSALDATNSITGTTTAGLKTTVTTLTIGGLNGTKDFASLFTTTAGGYSGVTALTLNPFAATSYSGVIADGAVGMTLTKTTANTQTLSGANTYTGATTINNGNNYNTFSTGLAVLSGTAGSINGSSAVNVTGNGSIVTSGTTGGSATLQLDNTLGTLGRIKDSTSVNLSYGGELMLTQGNTVSGVTETINALNFSTGHSLVSIGGVQTGLLTQLSASTLTRANLGTGIVRGSSLGTQSTNAARIILGTAPTGVDFVGSTTASTTTGNGTSKTLRIVPWLVGVTNVNSGNFGAAMVTYDSLSGLRPLVGAEQNFLTAGNNAYTTVGENVALNVALTTLTTTGPSTFNSLFVSGTNNPVLLGSGGSLTITSGALGGNSTGSTVGGFSVINLDNNEGVLLGDNSLAINSPVNVTSGGVASGGSLTKGGRNTLSLAAANLYTGPTTVNGGLLQLGSGGTTGALANGTQAIVVSGGSFGTNRSDAVTLANPISGIGGFTKNGIGTTTLTANNTFSGNIVANNGTLILDPSAAASNPVNYSVGTSGLGGALVFLGGGTLQFNGKAGATTTQTVGNISTGQTTNNGGTNNPGLGTLVVNNNGTATTVTAGAITRATNSLIFIDQSSGGVLTSNTAATNGLTANSGAVLVKNSANRIDFATNTANGAITALNASTVLPTITGVATTNYKLDGSQTQTGATTTNSLRINTTGSGQSLALGANALTISGGGLLFVGADDYSITGAAAIASAATNGSIAVENFGAGKLTVSALLGTTNGNANFYGNGSNLIDWNSTSNLTPSAGTNGQTLVSQVTLRLSNANAVSLTNTSGNTIGLGAIILANGGILELATGNLTRSISTAATGAVTFTGSGGFSAFGADRSVTFGNVATPLNWGRTAGAITPGFLDDGQSLILGSATSTHTLNFTNAINLGTATHIVEVRDGTSSSNVDGVLSGILSGTGGALTKSGAGNLSLTNTNTYTGATTIKAGTLTLNATGTIANSTSIIVGDAGSSGAVLDVSAKTGGFTIGSTQRLSGIGTIDANDGVSKYTVTINGVHSPGNSPGTQTVDGNLSYSNTSIFEWDLAANKDTNGLDNDLGAAADNGVPGTDYDSVTITGDLSINAAAVFKVIQNAGTNFGDAFWTTNQTWSNIFNVTGTTTSGWSNTAVSVFNTSNILQDVSSVGSFTITGSTLTWSAVPEPTSALAGLLIGAGLLRRRRA